MILSLLNDELEIEKDAYIVKKGGKWTWASKEQAMEMSYSLEEAVKKRDINTNILLILHKKIS
jgi:hypothetical protein